LRWPALAMSGILRIEHKFANGRSTKEAIVIVEDPSVEDIARMDGFEATGLVGLRDPVAALECSCMCHTRRFGMPTADVHDEGRTCPCQRMARNWSTRRDRLGEPCWCDERQDLAPLIDAERSAAVEAARRHGMQIRIERDFEPTIISGSYGGHRFWYHERQGDWQLRLHDFDGPLIAESGYIDLVEAVELIRNRMDRYDCSACGIDGSDAGSIVCGDCGRSLSPSASDMHWSPPR
jgi:hypothetical protein